MAKQSTSAPVATGARFDLVNVGRKVLWKLRDWRSKEDCVEEGSIVWMSDDRTMVNVCWLDGHSSRNDDVKVVDLLAVHDSKAPEMCISPFSGRGYILPAGEQWLKEHPEKP